MRVAFLRVLTEENWVSMKVYADRLEEGLRRLPAEIEFVPFSLTAWNWQDKRVAMPYGRPASLHTLGLYLSRWIRYPLALRQVKADVYHILDNSYGHLAFFLPRHKTVVTSHGGTPRSWRKWNPEGPAMWLFDAAFRGTQRAGRILIVSDYARQEFLQEAAHYPAGNVSVVYHGVDSLFGPVPAGASQALRAQLLQPGEEALLLHVGHSAGRKNVELLYRALAILRQQGRPIRLVRIGRGPSESQSQLIRQLDLEAHITHLPGRLNQELPAYYAAADLFLFPSLYEGFGIPLIEAMACGTPVVCSDSPLFREVCGPAASYIDPSRPEHLAQMIVDLLANPGQRHDLSQQGLSRATQFSWENSAKQTLAVYEQLLAGG